MPEEANSSLGAPIALIASVPLETEALRRRLHDMRPVAIGRKPGWEGRLAGRPVLLLQCGMGKANAAQALTALLEGVAVRAVVNFGVGGAYPGSGLHVGEVAVATREWYADEGVAAPEGWLSPREMGIALLSDRQGQCFAEFPVDAQLAHAASVALEEAAIAHRRGPFATVSACSGTELRGVDLADRLGVLVESMEGAACAHICRLYGVAFLEIRSISNLVEDRDPARWRLESASEAAARAVEQIVACW